MKSFEAWTDEIRAMMNPPCVAPVQWVRLDEARKIFNEPAERMTEYEGHWDERPLQGKEWMAQFYEYDQYGRIRWHLPGELRRRGLSLVEALRARTVFECGRQTATVVLSSGRRMGKSAFSAAMLRSFEECAKHGYSTISWDLAAPGVHDETHIIVDPKNETHR